MLRLLIRVELTQIRCIASGVFKNVIGTRYPLARIIHEATGIFSQSTVFIEFHRFLMSWHEKQSVYSTPEDPLFIKQGASHLTRSPSARGKPRFLGDRVTCFALLPLEVPLFANLG